MGYVTNIFLEIISDWFLFPTLKGRDREGV